MTRSQTSTSMKNLADVCMVGFRQLEDVERIRQAPLSIVEHEEVVYVGDVPVNIEGFVEVRLIADDPPQLAPCIRVGQDDFDLHAVIFNKNAEFSERLAETKEMQQKVD